MATILLIETATSVCSVGLLKDDTVVALRESRVKNSHAALVTVFAEEVVKETGISFDDIDAFAVSKGPGSYTGLRIGVSTAKGFSYATGKKLIAVNSLQSLSAGMVKAIENEGGNPEKMLFCPMIDARRMEVYTAVYNSKSEELKPTGAVIVDENSFSDLLKNNIVVFAGDGAGKCKPVLENKANARFLQTELYPSVKFMAPLALQRYKNNLFEDIAYFEPFYLKDFVAGIPRVKGLR
jgi:tRNA threonylcarbamoyladenosine biosynthesis protein TsaB